MFTYDHLYLEIASLRKQYKGGSPLFEQAGSPDVYRVRVFEYNKPGILNSFSTNDIKEML